ncbi:hypothetical protein G6031_03200 [Dietzia sp. CQ4]|uniref:hypothetical protein n=1 Tax=Dietzia sp. (strain CQ4) TaxID=370437 RepID=UPI0015FD3E66|nr:hypothetical protein [Dietzia sp. CQ4]MBB1033397.1 hypothetical protein [Dietzia sp. CQ4]
MGVDLSGGSSPTVPERGRGLLESIVDDVTTVAQALAQGVDGLIRGVIDMVLGRYEGDIPAFVDGQEALSNRLELLGKMGYCAVVMEQGYRLGPGRNRALPFNKMLGPNQDAELVTVSRQHPGLGSTFRTEACIRLDREGAWDATTFFSHGGDGYNNGFAEIAVLRPDFTVYSLATIPLTQGKSGAVAPNGGDPVVIPTSFVVPEPGYYVQVRFRYSVAVGIRTVRGGSRYNRLIVTQWSERVENDDVAQEGTGTNDDATPADP